MATVTLGTLAILARIGTSEPIANKPVFEGDFTVEEVGKARFVI